MTKLVSRITKSVWIVCGTIVGVLIAGENQLKAGSHSVAVQMGGSSEYDACGTLVAVAGLKKSGDGFLALRSGPASNYKLISKLPNGTQLWLCQEKGKWMGVLLRSPGADCGVSSPIARRQPYPGPCQSGWVYKKYIKMLAG